MESATYTSAWDIPVTDITGKQYAKLGDLVGDPKPALTVIGPLQQVKPSSPL